MIKEEGEFADKVILHEGSHHFFKEVHIFWGGKDGIEQSRAQKIEEVGPIEIPLAGAGRWEIYVRVQFFGYERNPIQSKTAEQQDCGQLWLDSDAVPIPVTYLLTADKDGGNVASTGKLPAVAEVRRKARALEHPPIPKLALRIDRTSFYLAQPQEQDVAVYLFGPGFSPIPPLPGTKVPLDRLPRQECLVTAVAHCVIPAGRTSANDPDPGLDWAVALPVALLETEACGLVGAPLAVFPLISDPEITTQPPRGVFARWSWRAPRHWIQVRMSWQFYDASGYDESNGREEKLVAWGEYSRLNTIEFLSYQRKGLRGWNVHLWLECTLLAGEDGHPPLETWACL